MIMESANAVLITVVYTMLSMTNFPYASATSGLGGNELIALNSCICEGHDQIYECRISGGGAIVWKGSAFNCPSTSNEIVFRSSSEGEKCCSDEAIVGRVTRPENNTYISHLTVSVSAQLVGMSISCVHDHIAQGVVGSLMITLTAEPYPPPDEIWLLTANSSQLIFQWSSAALSCEAVKYHINASGCGHCPNVTNDTTVTCTDFSLDRNQVCLLVVQTVVCDNITGNESRRTEVILRVPDGPEIYVIPTYSYDNKTLLRLATRFKETETFNISDGVDGSAISYTINYTSSNSGAICKTDEILVSASCVNGSCEHDYRVSTSTCFSSSHITVTVSGTNILGSGPPSDLVTIPGKVDQFVNVSVDLASNTVTCLFHQQTENSENYCSIVYGPSRENCQPQNQRKIANRSISDSNVVFVFPFNDSEHFQPQEEYCFIVTATNGSFIAQIEGTTIILDTSTDDSMLGTAAAIGVFVTTIAITLLGLLITIFVIVKKKLKSVFSSETQFINQSMTQRSAQATNNDSEVEQWGFNETNEQGIGIYSLLQSVGDEPESQTKPHNPVYVDIGPSTTSHENTPRFQVPLCDDKVEYAELKQTETRKFNTDTKPVLLDKHLDLDNLLIQLRDDVTPHWYEFGVIVGVPKEILDKGKDYPQDQCIVEVLDYWLMQHCGQLTWRDVAHALKEIQLHHLAEYIVQNSKTEND